MTTAPKESDVIPPVRSDIAELARLIGAQATNVDKVVVFLRHRKVVCAHGDCLDQIAYATNVSRSNVSSSLLQMKKRAHREQPRKGAPLTIIYSTTYPLVAELLADERIFLHNYALAHC
jgi:hypothetical protein